jgi:hypothetical protein
MMKLAFDEVAPSQDFSNFPIHLELRSSNAAGFVRLLMLTPMLVLLAFPFTIIAASAAEPTAFSIVLENPIGAAKALAGLTALAFLVAWPLQRVLMRFGARRTVVITNQDVVIRDRAPLRARTLAAPLRSYSGLAHHVRTSLSGTRHELILVHSDRRKSVLIAVADRISQDTLDRAKDLLGLPELPARQLYSRR